MNQGDFSVGLTGGIGSGKSTVAEMFAQRGASIIDTDVIAHHVTSPNGPAMPLIRATFGHEYVHSDGAMDRTKMRTLVFTDPAAKKRLENILHPLIREHAERQAANAQGEYSIFVVPLLIESGVWKQRVSRVLVIDCQEEAQILRVRKRNGMDDAQIRAIMASQVSRTERLAAADDIIDNSGENASLESQVDRLHAMYASFAKTFATNRSRHL